MFGPRPLSVVLAVLAVFLVQSGFDPRAVRGESLLGKDLLEKSTSATEVATGFLTTFAKKDLETVRALFAPGALVQRARLGNKAHDLAHFEATAWASGAEKSIANLKDFHIEILETQNLEFEHGTVVSVRFRATGRAGSASFVNNGVDTFAMIRVEGAWRIQLYNSMEKLVFNP